MLVEQLLKAQREKGADDMQSIQAKLEEMAYKHEWTDEVFHMHL